MLSQAGGPGLSIGAKSASEEDGDSPAIDYFYPDDVVGLHSLYRTRGLPVSDPRVTFHSMKAFDLRDPDGHSLCLGHETTDPPTPH